MEEKITIYLTTIKNDSSGSQELDSLLDYLKENAEAGSGIIVQPIGGTKSLAGTTMLAAEVIKTGALTKVAEMIGAWLIKDRSRSLKIKIENKGELEVSGITAEEQRELIKWFQTQAGLHL